MQIGRLITRALAVVGAGAEAPPQNSGAPDALVRQSWRAPSWWTSDANPVARTLRSVLIPVPYGFDPASPLHDADGHKPLKTPLGTVQTYHYFKNTPASKRRKLFIVINGNKATARTNDYARLLERKGQVISIDMPGYGAPGLARSTPPPGGYANFELPMAAMTRAVVKSAREELGIAEKDVTFAVTSMGSTEGAIGFALHPQSSLILFVPLLNIAELLPTQVGKQVRRFLPTAFDPTYRYDTKLSLRSPKDWLFQATQIPFYLWSATYGRALGYVLRSMVFPKGVESPAVPGFVTNGMNNEARLREASLAGTNTGRVLMFQAQHDHLMGIEYGEKMRQACEANKENPIPFELYTIANGTHASKPRPLDFPAPVPWGNWTPEQLAERRVHEARAWEYLEGWLDRGDEAAELHEDGSVLLDVPRG